MNVVLQEKWSMHSPQVEACELMKILQIVNYYFPSFGLGGGPAQCAYNLSKYMVKKGHEVTVYTTDASDLGSKKRIERKIQVINGAKVFFFPYLFSHYGFFIIPGLLETLRSTVEDFDVVHLHEYRTFQNLAFLCSKRRNVSYVLSAHGELEYTHKQNLDVSFLRWLYEQMFGKTLLRHADRLLALTELESFQYAKLGIDKRRITIIPNAIRSEDFVNPPPKGQFRDLVGLNEDQFILYLGRLDKRKGVDTLVQAFSALEQSMGAPLKLVLAGPNYGYLSVLKSLVSTLDLDERVIFTGPLNRQQVIAAYNDASIVVYATHSEGFPLVPLEAGAMGKPIIVSKHSSMDFVRKGNFGLSVDYGNASQLKDAIEILLNDYDLAEKLGKNGKKYVQDNFSWEIIAKKVENVYSEVFECSN